MKVISWNVNGFRSVMDKGVLVDLIEEHQPDVLLLQEIKCTQDEFEIRMADEVTQLLGGDEDQYSVLALGNTHTNKGRHGVATLVRNSYIMDYCADEGAFYDESLNLHVDPLVYQGKDIEGKDSYERESRLLACRLATTTKLGNVSILNTYSVNVRTGDTTLDNCRLAEREEYDSHMLGMATDIMAGAGPNLLIMGDFNVVHELQDVYKSNWEPYTAGMTASERGSFNKLLSQLDLTDSYRHLNPDAEEYSYWSYRGQAREYNRGWRIDYALVSKELLPFVERAEILTEVKGSDHAPILIEIREED